MVTASVCLHPNFPVTPYYDLHELSKTNMMNFLLSIPLYVKLGVRRFGRSRSVKICTQGPVFTSVLDRLESHMDVGNGQLGKHLAVECDNLNAK